MITVTETAASQIRKLLEKQHVEARGLRVGVKAGGCSGFEYVFAWEARPREWISCSTARTASACGSIRAAIALLDGTTLDYDTSLLSRGFVFQNPHAKATCGCGTSFRRLETEFPMPTSTETIEQLAGTRIQVRVRDHRRGRHLRAGAQRGRGAASLRDQARAGVAARVPAEAVSQSLQEDRGADSACASVAPPQPSSSAPRRAFNAHPTSDRSYGARRIGRDLPPSGPGRGEDR